MTLTMKRYMPCRCCGKADIDEDRFQHIKDSTMRAKGFVVSKCPECGKTTGYSGVFVANGTGKVRIPSEVTP